MAAKTPDNVYVHSGGDLRTIIAEFSTTNIDDNDTWASGIKSARAYRWESTLDGPQDCTVDAYTAATGTFTFASRANDTGRLVILARGY